MNQQDYFILWSVYAVAALILLLASIFFTSFLWRFLKEPIVLIIAILLFYPILIDPERVQYAPAIAIMAMDFLMQVGEHQVSIATQLFYIIEIVLVIYFVFAIFIRWPIEIVYNKWLKKKQQKKQELDTSNKAEHHLQQRNETLQANERL